IASTSGGDVRRALGLFENAFYNAENGIITADDVTAFDAGIRNYSDDSHYDLMSALQKSVRGSDPDAAVFYLNRLLAAGELIAACRRLQVMASEDVGPAYPLAAVVTRACCESAIELGLPEARIPLTNAAIILATAPKSNSAEAASLAAMADIEAGLGAIPPEPLRSPLFKGYRYPHDFPGHYVKQQYLPDDIKDRIYYRYGPNKTEQAAEAYAKSIGSFKEPKK
ncbi:MAG: replication-associated recombination protein A, partial [Clostridia bacterium]|nr:replication-associated recombination protein A [Clostridia bacterium]